MFEVTNQGRCGSQGGVGDASQKVKGFFLPRGLHPSQVSREPRPMSLVLAVLCRAVGSTLAPGGHRTAAPRR